MDKKFSEFVAEARKPPEGMSRREYAKHEYGRETADKTKDPIEVGYKHTKDFGTFKPKVGDRVTLGQTKGKRGTVHAINAKKTVAGMRKFHHVKWDDGSEDEHMRDHAITVWRHR